ncbi:Ger(x)C family spore germination protein [Evansella cellulosilytica]|uniref:Germination protein, Ger(X)C family n=1 Tax=Evansella cellulosilytica (strain ATCC 21833 / DSM 2522 / FERM P-1141 / JCM 9156 / N-4) TaxID=649639 RepID=E6TYZ7_EVAC2|nr:Ger(x)C family spore germination protein [Evansella cellulosilytica]ADU32440.1 germination protein, Ger(x)C family [Evansella cellulosilytica DSM 2522]
MNKLYRGIIVFTYLILLSGCWSMTEINDNAMVTIIFLDKGDDGQIELTLGFPLTNRMVPGEMGASIEGRFYTTVTKQEENIAAAYRLIQSDLPRKITWGQTKNVIIGKEFGEIGLHDCIDFLARQPSFPLGAKVFVAPGKATDITKLTPAFERFPSEVLDEFMDQDLTISITFLDFLKAYEYGGNVIVPMLTIGEEPMVSEDWKVSTWVGTGGAALFHDWKIVGTLNQSEMRGALWFHKVAREAVITIDSPTDGKPISIIVLDSKIQKRPSIDETGQLSFEITIEAVDDLLSVGSKIDINDPEIIDELEMLFAEAIKKRLERTFTITQEVGADVFLVGQYFEWHHPKEWEKLRSDWDNKYKEVTLDAHVTMKIKRHGAISNPPWVDEDE